jgi:ATP-dependent DNA ligase
VTASDTRNGNDWSGRYPLVFATMHGLRVRSCLIDGEIVVTRELSNYAKLVADETEKWGKVVKASGATAE